MTKPFGALLLLLTAGVAPAALITFDTLAAGTAVTNQFTGATFAPGSGRSVFVYADAAALSNNAPFNPVASTPNVICSTAAYGALGAACTDFTIAFANPVDGFSVDTFGWDSAGTSLVIRVFQGLTATDFTVTSPQQVNDKKSFSTNLTGITSVFFTSFSDPSGNTFDNFSFLLPNDPRADPGPGDAIPEPGALSLAVLGLTALVVARRSAAQ